MSTRTLILEEKEILFLIAVLDFYRDKIAMISNSTTGKLLSETEELKDNIISQSNKELDIKEQLNSK